MSEKVEFTSSSDQTLQDEVLDIVDSSNPPLQDPPPEEENLFISLAHIADSGMI